MKPQNSQISLHKTKVLNISWVNTPFFEFSPTTAQIFRNRYLSRSFRQPLTFGGLLVAAPVAGWGWPTARQILAHPWSYCAFNYCAFEYRPMLNRNFYVLKNGHDQTSETRFPNWQPKSLHKKGATLMSLSQPLPKGDYPGGEDTDSRKFDRVSTILTVSVTGLIPVNCSPPPVCQSHSSKLSPLLPLCATATLYPVLTL